MGLQQEKWYHFASLFNFIKIKQFKKKRNVCLTQFSRKQKTKWKNKSPDTEEPFISTRTQQEAQALTFVFLHFFCTEFIFKPLRLKNAPVAAASLIRIRLLCRVLTRPSPFFYSVPQTPWLHQKLRPFCKHSDKWDILVLSCCLRDKETKTAGSFALRCQIRSTVWCHACWKPVGWSRRWGCRKQGVTSMWQVSSVHRHETIIVVYLRKDKVFEGLKVSIK